MATPKLGITELAESQTNQEVIANAAFRRIESLAVLEVLDRDLTAPPGSPTNGDTYIVAASATGAWSGKDGQIAFYQDGWLYATAKAGMVAFVKDEKEWFAYSSVESSWHPARDGRTSAERWTGRYNGASKIYEKTIGSITGPTSGGSVSQAHSITGLSMSNPVVIEFSAHDGTTHYSGSSYFDPLSFIGYSVEVTSSQIIWKSNVDMSGFTGTCRLVYQK